MRLALPNVPIWLPFLSLQTPPRHSILRLSQASRRIISMTRTLESHLALTEQSISLPLDGGLKAWAQLFMGNLLLANSWGFVSQKPTSSNLWTP